MIRERLLGLCNGISSCTLQVSLLNTVETNKRIRVFNTIVKLLYEALRENDKKASFFVD